MRTSLRIGLLVVLAAAAACGRPESSVPSPETRPTVAPTPKPAGMTRAELAEAIVRQRYGETFSFPPTPFFDDVPASDARFRFVQRFRADGLTMGCSGNPPLFCPDVPAKRYMLATVIVRARSGETFKSSEKPLYEDVPASHANFRYVQKATEDGIVTACAPGRFCPEDVPSPEDCRRTIASFVGKAPAKNAKP